KRRSSVHTRRTIYLLINQNHQAWPASHVSPMYVGTVRCKTQPNTSEAPMAHSAFKTTTRTLYKPDDIYTYALTGTGICKRPDLYLFPLPRISSFTPCSCDLQHRSSPSGPRSPALP